MASQDGNSANIVRKRRISADPYDAKDLVPQMDDGSKREHDLAEGKKKSIFQSNAPKPYKYHYQILAIITLLAFATRLYKIQSGDFVVWDEAHFGKFASNYLKRTFYFDVHPPLGKMLVALGGWLSGYDGLFPFESAAQYPANVNYVFMRMFVASFGTLVVPLAYLTSHQLGFSQLTAVLVTAMILLESGLIGITRLILLDSMLIFFSMFTFWSFALFRQRKAVFGWQWKTSLMMTGVGIGCVSSVKWVGLFITAFIGLLTIEDLWKVLGESIGADGDEARKKDPSSQDPQKGRIYFTKHLFARVVCLIAIPVAIYTASFWAHFKILNKMGTGEGNMSSLFQAGLEGNTMNTSPFQIAYGSIITVKSGTYGGGLLHSHPDRYPEGSKQQQVTTYHHKDRNNDWMIVKKDHVQTAARYGRREETDSEQDGQESNEKNDDLVEEEEEEEIEFVQSGDLVKLLHVETGKFLHAHRIAAPINKKDWEVSAYGSAKNEDPNDLWQIEIVKDSLVGDTDYLRTLSSSFRLKHSATSCFLKSRNNQLPTWAHKQGEVSCDYTPELGARYLTWNIESNEHPALPPGDPSIYKSSFWEAFRDCNIGMWNTNNALTPDPELEPGSLTSTASAWFWMKRGIRICSWADEKTKFYMLGNPAVWWTGSASILALITIFVFYTLVERRGARMGGAGALLPTKSDYDHFKNCFKLIIGAWSLVYLPFFVMGRVLYLHHYYPALVFSVLGVGLLVEHTIRRIGSAQARNTAEKITVFAMIAITLITFIYFSPMCYGIIGPGRAFSAGRRWLRSWNL